MTDFSTVLLRERFAVVDNADIFEEREGDIIVLSNRIVIPLYDIEGKEVERLIVRSKNVHLCARMAAEIIEEYNRKGPVSTRIQPIDWPGMWQKVCGPFDEKYNPDKWVAVYGKGRLLYAEGDVHPLLETIEHLDFSSKEEYEHAIFHAQELFQNAGKDVSVTYDSNVALIINLGPKEGKVGVILRMPEKTATFSFKVTQKKEGLSSHHTLMLCAAYLEAIQLSFLYGHLMHQKNTEPVANMYDDEREEQVRQQRQKMATIETRIEAIRKVIEGFEELYYTAYRPERPSFTTLMSQSEKFAAKKNPLK